LGTCVPKEILGPSGYLPLKQTKIESLNLIAGGGCRWNIGFECAIFLRNFTELKKLSWRALRSEDDFSALHDLFEQTSHQMTDLELDLVSSQQLVLDKSHNFFARKVLGLTLGDKKQNFPALQTLSLAEVSFQCAEEEIAHAFSLVTVRSLKIRFCSGWQEFLEHSSRSTPPKALKSLEIQYSIGQERGPVEETISNFLETFQGLEQLAIGGIPGYETLDIWRSTLIHKATLKAFVNHQREINTEEDSSHFEEDYDSTDGSLSLFQNEINLWNKDPSLHPFGELHLEFLGMSCAPKLLVSFSMISERTLLLTLTHLATVLVSSQINALAANRASAPIWFRSSILSKFGHNTKSST
jgi:hypothetical protein